MKMTKRILAFVTALVLCFVPTMLMVAASDNGPCGHSLDYYYVVLNARTGVEPIGTASQCCYFVYDNAVETCKKCQYSMAWPYKQLQFSHSFVSSRYCVYCGYDYYS